MGLRSSLILCAGGVLSNLVLVPLIWMIGSHLTTRRSIRRPIPIAEMTASQIFRGYVRFIGVGAIATAGIFGILKSLRVVAGSFGVALHAFRRGETAGERTDRDISVMSILAGVAISAVCVGIFLGRLTSAPSVDPDRAGADAGLLVLLHLGRRQCDRDHGAQSGLGHDDADDHHFVGRAAAIRRFRARRACSS